MNLRRVMSDLRPPVLEERGLIPAVRELCSGAWSGRPRIRVELTGTTGPRPPRAARRRDPRLPRGAGGAVEREQALGGRAGHRPRRGKPGHARRRRSPTTGGGFDPTADPGVPPGGEGGAGLDARTDRAGRRDRCRSGARPGSGTTVVMASIPFDVLPGRSAQPGELDEALAADRPSPGRCQDESLAAFSSRVEEEDGPELGPASARPRWRRGLARTAPSPVGLGLEGRRRVGLGLGDGLGGRRGRATALGLGARAEGVGLGEGVGDGTASGSPAVGSAS